MNKIKRIAALVLAVLLGALYVVTLIVAMLGGKAAPGLFQACIYTTLVLPVLIYCFIMLCRVFGKKKDEEKEEKKK